MATKQAKAAPPKATKATTLRLAADQARELQAVAQVEGIAVTAVVRRAVAEHIETLRGDKAFQERRRKFREENRELIELLAK